VRVRVGVRDRVGGHGEELILREKKTFQELCSDKVSNRVKVRARVKVRDGIGLRLRLGMG
jgi:hypothetical protein